MVDFIINQPVKVNARFLRARCGVRYWEDGTVNGVEDVDGSLSPCREGESWTPLIDIDAGRIVDWPIGTTAALHYKVCDDGDYALLDGDMGELIRIDGYVPAMLSPGDPGGGSDYVIMEIGADGIIADWLADLSDFEARA